MKVLRAFKPKFRVRAGGLLFSPPFALVLNTWCLIDYNQVIEVGTQRIFQTLMPTSVMGDAFMNLTIEPNYTMQCFPVPTEDSLGNVYVQKGQCQIIW